MLNIFNRRKKRYFQIPCHDTSVIPWNVPPIHHGENDALTTIRRLVVRVSEPQHCLYPPDI